MNRRLAISILAVLTTIGNASHAQSTAWGTASRPFAAHSPWNSRPVNPQFGSAKVPESQYFPAVDSSTYSTGVFVAGPDDGPAELFGPGGQGGIWNADAEAHVSSIRIPRWPSSTVPATGSDGHADIVDEQAGVIHSLWQLKRVGEQWQASQYTWTPLAGHGWGTPAHYMQGSRSSGVPTLGGLIRKHEINDGQSTYKHALAVSLAHNGLAASPDYVFPATSTDRDSATTNSGSVPMGSLLMLPASYDTSDIANAQLKKIAETLKVYGAYVVDRNHGTPFVVYAEIGSNLALHPPGGWDSAVASELQRIRAALRPVVGAQAWLDGDGQTFTPSKNLNLLSMRGPWLQLWGTQKGSFDTWQQALVFPATGSTPSVMGSFGKNMLGHAPWATPEPGKRYTLTAVAQGGAKLKLIVQDCTESTRSVDTGDLAHGQSASFTWPQQVCRLQLNATSGADQASTISGTLVEAP